MPYLAPLAAAVEAAAPAITALTSVAALGLSTQQAVQGAKNRRVGRREQQAQQAAAEGQAASASRTAAERARAAEQKAPVLSSLLAGNTTAGNPTMLSGGVDPSALNLGRSTLLGG